MQLVQRSQSLPGAKKMAESLQNKRDMHSMATQSLSHTLANRQICSASIGPHNFGLRHLHATAPGPAAASFVPAAPPRLIKPQQLSQLMQRQAAKGLAKGGGAAEVVSATDGGASSGAADVPTDVASNVSTGTEVARGSADLEPAPPLQMDQHPFCWPVAAAATW